MASAYSNLKIEQIELSLLIKKALELTSIKNVDLQLQKNTLLHVDVVKSSIAIKNLIENAFKYSPKNSLIVVEGKTLNNEVVVSVVDQGDGIPEEQLKKITKAFVRIPGSKESGFGLGLSICNKVMVAHGGSLKIKNSDSGGACFSLHFPIKK
jgi:K+-sensing histidine kinase KdpD